MRLLADYTGACGFYANLCGDPSNPDYIDENCCTCDPTDANINCPAMPDDPNGCGDADTVGARTTRTHLAACLCVDQVWHVDF